MTQPTGLVYNISYVAYKRYWINRASIHQFFNYFKTNTKSIDIYRLVSILCSLNRTKILWKLQIGLRLTKVKQQTSKYVLKMHTQYIPSLCCQQVKPICTKQWRCMSSAVYFLQMSMVSIELVPNASDKNETKIIRKMSNPWKGKNLLLLLPFHQKSLLITEVNEALPKI